MEIQANRQAVERWARTIASTDLSDLDEVLHPDAEEIYPQSGERFVGRNIRAMIETYRDRALADATDGQDQLGARVERIVGGDERWVLSPLFTSMRVAGSGEHLTVVGRVRYPSGEEWHLVQIIEAHDGKIAKLTSYFAAPFDAPDWRAPFRMEAPS
jgi:hypothetical protein